MKFNPSNITSTFQVTEIWPFDGYIFTEQDFLPSFVTDQQISKHASIFTQEIKGNKLPWTVPAPSTESIPALLSCGPLHASQVPSAISRTESSLDQVNLSRVLLVNVYWNFFMTFFILLISDPFTAIQPYPRVAPISAPTKRRNKLGSTHILTATPERTKG